MRVVLQRVLEAKVMIDDKVFSEIHSGLLILLGLAKGDTKEDLEYLVNKILQLRIFPDEQSKMNLNIQDISGEVLIISQFTLFASTKKGNRPGFSKAEDPIDAESMYQSFIQEMIKTLGHSVKTGQFAADMNIYLVNQGPVTIFIDSKNKE